MQTIKRSAAYGCKWYWDAEWPLKDWGLQEKYKTGIDVIIGESNEYYSGNYNANTQLWLLREWITKSKNMFSCRCPHN